MIADDDCHRCKIVLLGESGSGKSSIIYRWTSNSFLNFTKPTVGSQHAYKSVRLDSGDDMELYIWDTAGQEQFEALMPLYARGSSVVVITAAINDAVSLESVPRWLETVASSCKPVPPCVLAVNKMDLVAMAAWTKDKIRETYDEFFASIFFVCAKNGENCTELLSAVANEAAKFLETVKKVDPPPPIVSREKQPCC
jgi:small GTP-binding protein